MRPATGPGSPRDREHGRGRGQPPPLCPAGDRIITGQRAELRMHHEQRGPEHEAADNRVRNVFDQTAAAANADQDLEHAGQGGDDGEPEQQRTARESGIRKRRERAAEQHERWPGRRADQGAGAADRQQHGRGRESAAEITGLPACVAIPVRR